jgi:hypothetical protein
MAQPLKAEQFEGELIQWHEIPLKYDVPTLVPQHCVAVCPKTKEKPSLVTVQNKSKDFALTMTISYLTELISVHIKANDPEAKSYPVNPQGSEIRVKNASSHAATALVTLIS